MSLRARLALVLAGVMVGPLVAAGVAIGIIVPRTSIATSTAESARAARAAAAALSERCRGVGDLAYSVAARLGAGAADGVLSQADVRAGLDAARRTHPEWSAAVTRPGLPPIGTGPRGSALAGADPGRCALGTAGSGPPVLGAGVDLEPDDRRLATVLVAADLDAAALRALQGTLGLGADLLLVETDRSRPAGRPVLRAGTAQVAASGSVLAALAAGERSGRVGDRPFAVRAASPAPFTVVAVGPQPRAVPVGLLALLAVAAALALVLVRVLSRRLAGPPATGEPAEPPAGGDPVADTYAMFGDALGRTHDLNGLLHTVVAAAMRGAGAVVGVALLADDDGDAQERVRRIEPAAGDGVQHAADRLRDLALEAFSRRSDVASVGEPGVLGPAVAMPLRRDGDRMVGALAVARAAGAAALEPPALAAVSALARHTGTAVHNVRDHERIRRQSVTDPLTGAGNFRLLSTTLSREVERATRFDRPLSVMMLDLDHFKQVNDSLGHAFGDAVLREFAHRLQACLREVDTVARYGGEEFAVLLPETDTDGGSAVAERILTAVRAEPFRSGTAERAVTVSIGVASYPVHGRTASEVMRCADAALYEAKRAGRDRWCLAARAGDAPTVSHAG